jgi:transposase
MQRTVSVNAAPKKYDEAFKRQAVEMVLHGGKTVKQVADELGVSPYSIYEWKRKLFPLALPLGPAGKTSAPDGQSDEVAKLHQLIQEQQRQIAELTQQREILKKTLGIVCEGPSSVTNGSKK